ncbi:hypothetical protein JTE90_017582 [Oedothorax gibbosus]|uniref:Uncharacterized protein n=1 Tax=Oedothorax gibbosus TaxID=931172 RepID=A0AAV6TM12_9ARAC|nr:hypothetical protein JTE90_017582 [Oedothorax gibbosus]
MGSGGATWGFGEGFVNCVGQDHRGATQRAGIGMHEPLRDAWLVERMVARYFSDVILVALKLDQTNGTLQLVVEHLLRNGHDR